jgi:transposase-like protein
VILVVSDPAGEDTMGARVLLAVRGMGGESEAAWRAVLDDLVARGLKTLPRLRSPPH